MQIPTVPPDSEFDRPKPAVQISSKTTVTLKIWQKSCTQLRLPFLSALPLLTGLWMVPLMVLAGWCACVGPVVGRQPGLCGAWPLGGRGGAGSGAWEGGPVNGFPAASMFDETLRSAPPPHISSTTPWLTSA